MQARENFAETLRINLAIERAREFVRGGRATRSTPAGVVVRGKPALVVVDAEHVDGLAP